MTAVREGWKENKIWRYRSREFTPGVLEASADMLSSCVYTCKALRFGTVGGRRLISRDDSCKMNQHARYTHSDTTSCRTTTDRQYMPTYTHVLPHTHTHKTQKIMSTLEWATATRKKMGSGHLKTSSPAPFQSNCLLSLSLFHLFFFPSLFFPTDSNRFTSQQKSSALLSFVSLNPLCLLFRAFFYLFLPEVTHLSLPSHYFSL